MRIASARARVPGAVIDDACQTAWMRLCERGEVVLDDKRAVVGWLVTTAAREAWRDTRRRETPVGGWQAEVDVVGELPEPAGPAADPAEVVIGRERFAQLCCLTARERRFLGLQAAGLTYEEIAVLLGVTRRTTERQILRGRHKLEQGGAR